MSKQFRALFASTLAYVFCFAIWTLFSIIGVKIKQQIPMSNAQFSLLISLPMFSGSVSRVFLGVLADKFGGRLMSLVTMLITVFAAFILSLVKTYDMFLLAALGLGLAGGIFAVGVSYVSKWFELKKQGTALGIYGLGVAGASITGFVAPVLLDYYDWQDTVRIYAIALAVFAVIFWLITDKEPENDNYKAPSAVDQIRLLTDAQVWRISFYAFLVFGGFTAIILWLPRYYMEVYHMDIKVAGTLTGIFALSGGMFRMVGGILSDKMGPHKVLYLAFIICIICTLILSYPPTDHMIHGMTHDLKFSFMLGVVPFVIISAVLAIFMSFAMAAAVKHVCVFYPNQVGTVGGIVGLIAALGGFILPILFGYAYDYIQVWTVCFALLSLLLIAGLILMHICIVRAKKINGIPTCT